MPSNFQRLAAIASKESKHILGLMSGTSMDGLDVALCRVTGRGFGTKLELLEFGTIPHTEEYQEKVRSVFARAEAQAFQLTFLNTFIADVHANQVLKALEKWKWTPDEIDLIASHGQTVYHNPHNRAFTDIPARSVTLQLGDGDFMATRTGIITVSDFRQKHIAAGGEGAPLALYGDLLLCSSRKEDRLLLNIGGIANFTWLPRLGSGRSPVCSDTGPGNTLLDAFIQRHYGRPYDKDAQVGRSGEVNQKILDTLMDDPFFSLPLPRTTGPELFNLEYLDHKLIESGTGHLPGHDIMATLHAFTTQSIASSIKEYLNGSMPIFVSGGGMHNPLLMQNLKREFPGHAIEPASRLGIDPDAKEAIIFAVMANECLFGQPDKYPLDASSYPNITLGKVSFP
ncbi:MAG TPA: anhydro-N-acetylmuramic acid kinase [Sphingobacteriaceae bacterium]|nr:anhydro-N-acetylmuramic acid kinase [Sphingobacteriaceae bacterium]